MTLALNSYLTPEEINLIEELANEIEYFNVAELEACNYSLLLIVKDVAIKKEFKKKVTPITKRLGIRLFIYNAHNILPLNCAALAIFDGNFYKRCENSDKGIRKLNCSCIKCEQADRNLSKMYDEEELSGMDFGQYLVIHNPYKESLIVPANAGAGKSSTCIERQIFLRVTGAVSSLHHLAFITHTNASTDDVKKKMWCELKNFEAGCKRKLYNQLRLEYQAMPIMTISKFAEFVIGFAGRTAGMTMNDGPKNIEAEVKKQYGEALSHYLAQNKLSAKRHDLYNECLKLNRLATNKGIQLHEITFPESIDSQQQIVFTVLKQVSEKMANDLKSKRQYTLTTIFDEAESVVQNEDGYKLLDGVIQYLTLDESQDASGSMLSFILSMHEKVNLPLMIVGQKSQSIYGFIGGQAHSLDEMEKTLNSFRKIRIRHNYRTVKVLANAVYKMLQTSMPSLKDDLPTPITKAKIKGSDNLDDHLFIEEEDFSIEYLTNFLKKVGPGKSVSIIQSENKEVEEIKKVIRNYLLENGSMNGYTLDESGQLYLSRGAIVLSVLLKYLMDDSAVQLPKELQEELALKHDIHLKLYDLKMIKQQDVIYTLLEMVDKLSSLNAVKAEMQKILTEALAECNRHDNVVVMNKWLNQKMTKAYELAANEIPQAKPNTICVTTIHKVKGLEFDVVFLTKLSKNIKRKDTPFITKSKQLVLNRRSDPKAAEEEDKQHLEERMRLLYVALTRAIETLVLMDVKRMDNYESFANYLLEGRATL